MLGRSAMPAQTHVLTDAEIVLRDGVLPWYSWNQMAVSRGAVGLSTQAVWATTWTADSPECSRRGDARGRDRETDAIVRPIALRGRTDVEDGGPGALSEVVIDQPLCQWRVAGAASSSPGSRAEPLGCRRMVSVGRVCAHAPGA